MNRTLAEVETSDFPPAGPTYNYQLYGLRVRSRIRLTLEEDLGSGPVEVELLPGAPEQFAEVISQLALDSSDWIHLHEVEGGWSYIRYDEMFDFLVSPPGDRIFYRHLGDVSAESFQAYALGRVFSFALVKMGHEPLHSATVVVNGHAVAFLGASTFGKSSLAACFVAAGHPLLTDDVLRLEERGGCYFAFPGPPYLKLLPGVARRYLPDMTTGVPINNRDLKSPKLLFSLPAKQWCATAVPLAAIYVVAGPRKVYRKQRITVSALPAVDALVSTLSFTHNHKLTGRSRLQRQFDAARRLIGTVPMRSLAYPRVLSSLNEVKDAILEDVRNYVNPI